MNLSNNGIFRFGYERYRSSLPKRLQLSMQRLLGIREVTSKQAAIIRSLGESIGLERGEVIAATSLPIDNIDARGRGEVSILGVVVAVFVVMIISFGIIIMMAGGNVVFTPVPTYTYAPGTRYGSISPNDFQNP